MDETNNKEKNDKKLLTVILAIALIAFAIIKIFFRSEGAKVLVTVDGKEYGTYSLYKETSIDIIDEYGTNTVVITGGQVRVLEADCPDQICVEHAPISTTDETIVCLPHKLVVEIINDSSVTNDDLDGVAN